MDSTKDKSYILALETREALRALEELDRCGYPVLTSVREAAIARVEAARAAENLYWNT